MAGNYQNSSTNTNTIPLLTTTTTAPSNPKKRSTELAFLTSNSNNNTPHDTTTTNNNNNNNFTTPTITSSTIITPLHARPPSRSNIDAPLKRARYEPQGEKPIFVTSREESISLATAQQRLLVDVRWPGEREIVRGEFEWLVGLGVGGVGGVDSGSKRIKTVVLCFFGEGGEGYLTEVSQVISLLRSLHAATFAVSMTATVPVASAPSATENLPFPLIHDFSRSLTLSLGLMHPLGGGRHSLDAIVVLDSTFRRRMLLPIWGDGGAGPGGFGRQHMHCHMNSDSGGVQMVVGKLVKGVEWLVGEEVEARIEMHMSENREREGGSSDVEMG